MQIRAVIASLLGIVTAFGLFWVMQALVNVRGELKDAGSRLSIDFVRLRRDKAPETKKREPPKRQKPEQQPAPPQMNLAKNMAPGDAVGEIVPMMDTSAQLQEASSLGGGGVSRDPVPLVQVDPRYPPRAEQRRIRGYVDVEFTISPVGTVQDARVIGSKPPFIFDRAALQAVRRWKYKPQIQNGVATARPGMQIRFHFSPDGSS